MSDANDVVALQMKDSAALSSNPRGLVNDQIHSLFDHVRFIKAMADIETGKDEPEPHQFNRDQQLTPAALFKAKVLAVLDDEANKWSYVGTARTALDRAAGIIRDIQP